jgi:hypothetical protein
MPAENGIIDVKNGIIDEQNGIMPPRKWNNKTALIPLGTNQEFLV